MRYALILTLVGTLWTTAAFAQEKRGYLEGTGSVTSLPDATSGSVTGEVGFKVLRNLVVFGNIGNIHDTGSATLQASVDQTAATLAANPDQPLTATGTSRVPAWYSMGGARILFPTKHGFTPYALGSVGYAKLDPQVHFTYESGTTPTGATPAAGEDITNDIVASGLFTKPTSSNGAMVRGGGGVQVPIGKHLMGDVAYSVSHISADTPITGQDVAFGMGVRF